MGLGVYLVLGGFREVFDTRFDIADENTIPRHSQSFIPVENDPHFNTIITTFQTNDIFAVDNKIDVDLTVNVNNSSDINQTIAFVYSKQGDISWIHNENTVKKTIEFYMNNNPVNNGVVKGKLQGINTYDIHFTYFPSSTESQIILVFLQTLDGTWFPSPSLDLLTVEQASSMIQLKNSRVVEGL